jgi:hypothetical protein
MICAVSKQGRHTVFAMLQRSWMQTIFFAMGHEELVMVVRVRCAADRIRAHIPWAAGGI